MNKHVFEINEAALRDAIRSNRGSAKFPFTVAKQYRYTDKYGIDQYRFAIVYGKKTKTIAIAWHKGYNYKKHIIGHVPNNSGGYSLAAELIEKASNLTNL